MPSFPVESLLSIPATNGIVSISIALMLPFHFIFHLDENHYNFSYSVWVKHLLIFFPCIWDAYVFIYLLTDT